MNLGESQQPFASPEEALKHHGVKGMKWGERNKDRSSGRDVARRNAEEKARIAETVATRNATPRQGAPLSKTKPIPFHKATEAQKKDVARGLTGTDDVSKVDPERHGLTSNQKKALVLVGATAVIGGGYIAYRHYAGGPILPDATELAKGPVSKNALGELGKTFGYGLDDTHLLAVNTSRGYADIVPKSGLNPYASARHAELIETLDAMRERFPAVRNMNIEVAPMSHSPGFEPLLNGKSPAAVMSMGRGEARLVYNDLMTGLSSEEASYVKQWQPGVFTQNFLGNHEMGHILAAAHGEIAPVTDLVNADDAGSFTSIVRAQRNYVVHKNSAHKALFKRHGLSFNELSKLSKYAATEPAEALAELSGHYFTPETRAQMSPEMAAKAKSLFDELGGVAA